MGHILFNFACDFFLVHWWGFSDVVIQHFTFIVQGMPSWFFILVLLSDCGLGLSILLSTTWSLNCPPSKLIFCEAFVSQIKTLLEPKLVADGYLWIFSFFLSFFLFFTWSSCLKQASSSRVSRTSLVVVCTTSCNLENLLYWNFQYIIVLGTLTVSPKHWFLQQHFSCIKEEKATTARDF